MNILVSNLSTNIIDHDLLKVFGVYGTVAHVSVVREVANGRSMGRAFLMMPNESEGEQAILALHNTVMDGMKIEVQAIDYEAGEFNN